MLKALSQSGETASTTLSSDTNPVILSQKAAWLVQHYFHLVNPCQHLTSTSPVCPEMQSEQTSSITFPEIKVRLTPLQFLWSSFWHFVKTDGGFAVLQVRGEPPPPNLYDLLALIWNSPVKDCSLSTLRCSTYGPMDLDWLCGVENSNTAQ